MVNGPSAYYYLDIVLKDHHIISVTPTAYVTQGKNGALEFRYLPPVLTYVAPYGKVLYLRDPRLYHWLRGTSWESDLVHPLG